MASNNSDEQNIEFYKTQLVANYGYIQKLVSDAREKDRVIQEKSFEIDEYKRKIQENEKQVEVYKR